MVRNAVGVVFLTLASALGAQQSARQEADLRQEIARLGRDPLGVRVPAVDSVTVGGRSIAAGTTVEGSVAVARGNLDVTGVITGDAIALHGDVIVHRGGIVRGNAVAVDGEVRLDGGDVFGDMRTLSAPITQVPTGGAQLAPMDATKRAVELALGWFAVLAFLGIGVLMFAGSYLDGVVETLEHRFMRSFWVGLVGQLALAPALLLLVVALAITIIGVLLIPFGIVAVMLAAAGLGTLGFLAMARVTGSAIRRSAPSATERGATLAALMVGLSVYMSLWLIAAAFTWSPVASSVLRVLAIAVSWAALTAGFGAALLSRGGSRRAELIPQKRAPIDDIGWQTPTPVSGVAAARRPTPVAASRDSR